MFDKPAVIGMAEAMARHAARRQNAIAENIANADTPGYRARDMASFAESYRVTWPDEAMRATRSGHLDAAGAPYTPGISERSNPGSTSPNGNTVSLEEEMVFAAAVKRDHDLALAIYQNAMGILRTSLGRGR